MPTIGFAGETAPEAMNLIRAEGFTTVDNLRLPNEKGADVEADRAAAEQAGLKFVHIPFFSGRLSPEVFDAYLATLQADEQQPVYVYCASGLRVAAIWMAGRVLEDDWSLDAAAAEVTEIAASPDRAVALGKLFIESMQP